MPKKKSAKSTIPVPPKLEEHVLALFRHCYGADWSDEEILKFDPNEIDEMDLKILDASLGQPMPNHKLGIETQTVLSSTLHYPDGPMVEMMGRAAERGWPVHTWCYRESNNPVDGWLRKGDIKRMRDTVTSEMWRVEFELGEPSSGNRAIDTEAVEQMFDKSLGEYDRKTTGREMWLPVGGRAVAVHLWHF